MTDVGVPQLAAASGIGLAAGVLGGLAGIGGSLVILPSLGLLFGYPRGSSQHLYMAAALLVNMVVAVPAALRHHRAGAMRRDLVMGLLPPTAIAMTAGVLTSNLATGHLLRYLLAAFLFIDGLLHLRRLVRRRPDRREQNERVTAARRAACAVPTGYTAGLLGLGGGILMVPLLQLICRVGLRESIATSAGLICFTAPVGAALKLATLHAQGESAGDALLLAGAMAPSAILGAWLGATLTHRLPLKAVRGAMAIFLIASAVRMTWA